MNDAQYEHLIQKMSATNDLLRQMLEVLKKIEGNQPYTAGPSDNPFRTYGVTLQGAGDGKRG